MLLSTSQVPTLASELTLPERVNEPITFTSQLANNVYLSNYDVLKNLGATLRSEHDGRLSAAYYDLNAPTDFGTKNAHQSFSLPNTGGSIAQFENKTNDPLSLDLSFKYLHLTSNDTATSVENTVLFNGEQHIFTVNLTANVPYALSMNIHGNSESETLSIRAIAPSTKVSITTITLYTHLTNIETIIPTENGTYIFALTPTTGDIILDKLVLYKDLSVISITNSFSETLTGKSSTIKVFKLNINVTSPLGMLSFDQFTYISQFIDDYSRNANLLGLIRVKFFTPLLNTIFGASVGSTTALITPGDTAYVVIEALPPDPNDPYVRGEKDRLGLPDGFYAEYSFWTDFYPLSAVPTNVDTTINPILDPSTNKYYYYTSVPVVISFNRTGTSVGGIITSLSDMSSKYLSNQDLLKNDMTNLIMLDPGLYYVRFYDSFLDGSASFRFSPKTIQTLDMGTSTHTYNLYDVTIYRLPANIITKDVLNITYLDYLNMSTSFRFLLYDAEGYYEATRDFTFDQYGNNVDPYYAQNNNTEIGFAGTSLVFNNFNDLYLVVVYNGNTVWNSTMATPTALEINSTDYTAQLRIVREDYWETRSFNDTSYEYIQDTIGTTYTHALNASKTESLFRLNFTPSVGGNRLIINAENMTYNIQIATDVGDIWYAFAPTMTTINNKTVYQVDFAFPSVGVPMGIMIYFTGSYTDNGALSINTSNIAPIDLLSYYTFHSLLTKSIPTDSSSDDTDVVVDTNTTNTTPEAGSSINPWYIGGGIFAILALGGSGFVFYKKRKK